MVIDESRGSRPSPKGELMEYKRRDMRPFLMSPGMARVVHEVGTHKMRQAASLVGKDSGETAATGRVDLAIGGRRGDRWVGTVSFRGNAVAEQFGNRRRPASRFLTRALEMP